MAKLVEKVALLQHKVVLSPFSKSSETGLGLTSNLAWFYYK